MSAAAIAKRYSELGFRVIEGGKSGKLAVLKTPAVAEIFGRQHKDVLESVRLAQKILGGKFRQGFAEHCRDSKYRAADGKDQPCFELTKVGFNTVAASYDVELRFLLALAFDALERDDAGADVIRQINQRIRELRSRASGQDELTLELPAPTVAPPPIIQDVTPEFPYHYHRDYAEEKVRSDNPPKAEWSDLPPAARQEWREKYATPAQLSNYNLDDEITESETKARSIWARNREDVAPFDYWTDGNSHIRLRNDLSEVWITSGDASIPCDEKKWPIRSPNGSFILFYFNSPPPIEVVLRTYDRLGHGPYAAIGKATLRHFLT